MSEHLSISELIPKSLDDIIREHRNQYSLRLSINEDFGVLSPMVSLLDKHQHIRATINEWRVICLVRPEDNALMLIGKNESTRGPWITSQIISVDFEKAIVLTENSIYKLGSKGEGEPNQAILLHICATFHQWGMGKFLGVPYIFY